MTRQPPAAKGAAISENVRIDAPWPCSSSTGRPDPALLDVQLTAVGCRDQVLVLTGEPEVAVGVRIGPRRKLQQDPRFVQHDAPGQERGGAQWHQEASSVHRAILFEAASGASSSTTRPTDQGIGGPLDQPRSGRLTHGHPCG